MINKFTNNSSNAPSIIDDASLSEETKNGIVKSVNSLFKIIKGTNPNAGFKDLVQYFADNKSVDAAERAYDLLYKGYKMAKLPGYENIDYNEIYLNIKPKQETFEDLNLHIEDEFVIPFDEDQLSNPEYYENRIKNNSKKHKIKFYQMKGWHYTSIIVTIVLLTGGVEKVVKNNEWGYLWIISAVLSVTGILLNIYQDYYYYRHKASRVLLIIAGVLSLPIGFLLMAAGILLNEQKSKESFEFIEDPDVLKDTTSGITKKSLLGIRNLVKVEKIKYYLHIGLSTFVGFILGWYFKVPNTKLMSMFLHSNSLMRKDFVLEYHRKNSPFFSTELFSFNWIVFIFSTLICFFILMYLNDVKFRQYIHDKIESLKLKRQ